MASRRRAAARRPSGEGTSGGTLVDERAAVVLMCGVLALAVWLVFGQTLHHGFVNYDDNEYVYDNPAVVPGLTLRGIAWAFTHAHANNWHPLTWLSHMADCQLYGLDPAGHHLTSVVLHALNAILLFLVLRRMTGAFWPSAFVAMLFGVHPLRAESVAWVSERKDVLSGTFFMLTLAAYQAYVSRPSRWRYLAVLLALALGLMSKPMLVTVPVVLLLLDYWPLARWSRATASALMREKLPLLALVLISIPLTLIAQRTAIQPLDALPLQLRLANAVQAYVAYLGDLIAPIGLAVFRPRGPLDAGTTVLALVLLAAITALAVRLRRTRPYVLIGWAWYVVMLAPTIGIIQVGIQTRADRYTYLPQIGLTLLVAWGAADLVRRWRGAGNVVAVAAAGVVAAAIIAARAQVSVWRDSESLWSQALAHTTNNSVAECNLGAALLEQGRRAEAMTRFDRALAIDPDYREAHVDLGNALLDAGHADEAIAHYRQVLALDPAHANAALGLGNGLLAAGRTDEAIVAYRQAVNSAPDSALAHNNLGNALLRNGQVEEATAEYRRALAADPRFALAHNNLGNALSRTPEHSGEAIDHYRRALELDPNYAEAHYNLGIALFQSGQVAEATRHYLTALALRPTYAEAHNNLGVAYQRDGRMDEAIVEYRSALENDPQSVAALDNLARALATHPEAPSRRPAEALTLAERAVELGDGRNAEALRTLALAYAASGRFDDAVGASERALTVARAAGDAALVEQLESDLVQQRARRGS